MLLTGLAAHDLLVLETDGRAGSAQHECRGRPPHDSDAILILMVMLIKVCEMDADGMWEGREM